ncbi:MAG: acyltransferase family protein [Sphingomicrobium sp.]
MFALADVGRAALFAVLMWAIRKTGEGGRIWDSTGPHVVAYRPEIDGLRAIAVLAVMLFHAGIPGFGGGYIGVDVFFVISGFVITNSIGADVASGSFSFLKFYTRRARRIIPALAFVSLICAPVAWFVMVPHEIMELSAALFAVAAFASNVLFWFRSNYFAPDAQLNPLLHTWSLAVEEQFYLLFPLLFVVLWRVGRRWLVTRLLRAVLLLLLVASLAAAQIAVERSPVAAFYLAPFRIWELLAGALAARSQGHASANQALAALGMVLVVGSIVLLQPQSAVPGLAALPAVGGTVLLLLFSRADMRGNGLAGPMLVRVGLISYSLYLWHQPLLAFARVATLDQLPLAARAALMVAAFPLAYLTWRFIEMPFRDRRRTTGWMVWSVAGAFTVTALALGAAGFRTWGFYDAKLRALPQAMQAMVIDRPRELQRRTPLWEAMRAAGSRPFGPAVKGGRVLILGDSKAEDLHVSTRLRSDLFKGMSIRAMELDDPCMSDMARLLDGQLAARALSAYCRIDIAPLIGSGLLGQSDTVVLAALWDSASLDGAARLAAALHRRSKRVAVIGMANFNDPSSLSMRLARRGANAVAAEQYLWANKLATSTSRAERLRGLVSGQPGVEYHSAFKLYCNDAVRRCRMYDRDGRPLLFDSGHVTIEGARFVGGRIAQLGWFNPR